MATVPPVQAVARALLATVLLVQGSCMLLQPQQLDAVLIGPQALTSSGRASTWWRVGARAQRCQAPKVGSRGFDGPQSTCGCLPVCGAQIQMLQGECRLACCSAARVDLMPSRLPHVST